MMRLPADVRDGTGSVSVIEGGWQVVEAGGSVELECLDLAAGRYGPERCAPAEVAHEGLGPATVLPRRQAVAVRGETEG